MTRPSTLTIALAAALLIAGSASLLAYRYLEKHAAKRPKETVAVVTAAAEIPVGTVLDQSKMRVLQWPKEAASPAFLTDPGKLVGRVALRAISAGDAITEPKLVPAGNNRGGIMTYLVPQGHRAVTVAVNEVAGVAGFITPSSKVDVVLTTPRPGSKDENVSKIILQNVPILATGQVTDQKEGKPVVVPTVTLDLIPPDAEKLVVSSSKGSLQLLLRNIADSSPADSKGATVAKVLSGVEPAPETVRKSDRKRFEPRAKPVMVVKSEPPPSYMLEIVRGTEKTTRRYTE